MPRSMTTCRFFFNDTATTEIYTLSLHDALPISAAMMTALYPSMFAWLDRASIACARRSEEHTSELQSRQYLVCRLLLENKKLDAAGTRLGARAGRSAIDRRPATRAAGLQRRRRRCVRVLFFLMIRRTPRSTLFPYTTLFR